MVISSHFLSHHRQDFDDLLSKYAMAEVTIDQLRLGAKLNLYSDQPQPAQAAVVQPGMSSLLCWLFLKRNIKQCLLLVKEVRELETDVLDSVVLGVSAKFF